MDLRGIHQLLVSGERQEMVKQIQDYGEYDFFSDYERYLSQLNDSPVQLAYFRDVVISYFRITNR